MNWENQQKDDLGLESQLYSPSVVSWLQRCFPTIIIRPRSIKAQYCSFLDAAVTSDNSRHAPKFVKNESLSLSNKKIPSMWIDCEKLN